MCWIIIKSILNLNITVQQCSMQAQIRMAESGHSYHYTGLTTVHALMLQIRKDFKIQLEDQKIIIKNGQLLKSNTSFSSVHQHMKKTIPTNLSTALNPLNATEIHEIQCLYIYNQKELLKPIQLKPFNEQHYLKLHREKFKEMSQLAENSYELKQFNEKISQKNILPIIDSISKRLKIPLENITHRFTRFHDNLNQRQYYKIQIASLLDLIQNQDKARKLLIKNVEWTHDKRTKKKLNSLKQKIQDQIKHQNQTSMKENSNLLSSQKDNHCSDVLKQLSQVFKQHQTKNALFFQRLKNSKRQVTKTKFLTQERMTFQIDKKITTSEKKFEESIKQVKSYFEQFCQEITRVNVMITKNKESKDAIKQLMFINDKIVNFQKIVEESVKEFTQMYLELTKIHVKSESQNIKIVFGIYVELIKAYEELQSDVRKFEKQYIFYKEQKNNEEIKVSQFGENSRNNNLPLKKQIRSPKKEDSQKRSQRLQESSVTRQLESNMGKINSPIKNKICKNSLKSFSDETNSKNFEMAIKQNKQLVRRLEFNRRLEGLIKYCSDLCDREQEMRKNFKNSKHFEYNKIQLLNVLNIPTIDIDYNQTSDVELTQMYKKWLKENSLNYETQINWELQIVDLSNSVSRTLSTYLENNSNTTEREKSMEKIMAVLSDTFYKIMKVKVQKEVEHMRKTISKNPKSEDKELIQSLMRSNDDLQEQITSLQQQIKRLSEQNKSSLESLEEAITPQTYQLLSEKYHDLVSNFRSLEDQNQTLKSQTKSLEAQLFAYQEEVKQTTQKLIQSYEESNASELQKLSNELKAQKELTLRLSKEIKGLQSELEVGKKNLLKQLKNIENLFEKIGQLTEEKDFYDRQFGQLKNLLADKQVAIIKLQKQLEALSKQSESHKVQNKQRRNEFQQGNEGKNNQAGHQCEFSQEVTELRQKNEQLELEIQSLDRQLKDILFKQTFDQEIQTQQTEQSLSHEQEYRIKKGKQNVFIASSQEQNRETSKILPQQRPIPINQHPQIINQLATKQSPLNNFHISNELNLNTQLNQAVSHYYVSSMGQQWVTSVFNKFTHLVIGKTIEQGMSHIFLPFSSDIYIGVTVSDEGKNFTSYQDYLSHQSSRIGQRVTGEPIYVLDLKEFNLKTNEMLRECSLVLVVKIEKKGQVSMGNKVMVSGKIQFALGFEDDDMLIKNYSHFLDE